MSKVHAIQYLRNTFTPGMGLHEAKALVEAIEEQLSIPAVGATPKPEPERMTLRDEFAKAALPHALSAEREEWSAKGQSYDYVPYAADCAYAIADAMLKARGQ